MFDRSPNPLTHSKQNSNKKRAIRVRFEVTSKVFDGSPVSNNFWNITAVSNNLYQPLEGTLHSINI